jgi:hypothetical protein
MTNVTLRHRQSQELHGRSKAQGLVSVKALWCKAQGYTNRGTANQASSSEPPW